MSWPRWAFWGCLSPLSSASNTIRMALRDLLQSISDWFFGPQKPEEQPPPQRPQQQARPQRPPQEQTRPQRPQQQVAHARRPSKTQQPSRDGARRPSNTAEDNSQNEHYQSLRTLAKNEGAEMVRCFEQSHTAYASGERALAKELSNQGNAHKRDMEEFNTAASEWIYAENNKNRESGEVDLHGLYVKEAITFTEKAIQRARRRGDARINFIVGKGLHSPQGLAKLKPAIADLMQRQGLIAELDENNAGVLIVSLDGRRAGGGTVLRPDDITRRLESKDNGCAIM